MFIYGTYMFLPYGNLWLVCGGMVTSVTWFLLASSINSSDLWLWWPSSMTSRESVSLGCVKHMKCFMYRTTNNSLSIQPLEDGSPTEPAGAGAVRTTSVNKFVFTFQRQLFVNTGTTATIPEWLGWVHTNNRFTETLNRHTLQDIHINQLINKHLQVVMHFTQTCLSVTAGWWKNPKWP